MTSLQLGGTTNKDAYQTHMEWRLGPHGPRFDVGNPIGSQGALARGSNDVADMKALVDADLATMFYPTPDCILSNLGSVELVFGLPAQAQWEADYAYILDAFHTKWPNAQVYLARPWRRDVDANANTIAGWIDNVLAARSGWAHLGPDERVVIKASDNGVANTVDGLHLSLAGVTVWVDAWLGVLGY
jgi:hypothetical protein